MTQTCTVSRREFLKTSLITSSGLYLAIQTQPFAVQLAAAPHRHQKSTPPIEPNAWLHIAPDDTITITVASAEMGQGVLTAIPMLIAEELDADWTKVKVKFAPVDPQYVNPGTGRQRTGGSESIREFWQPLREVGAKVRAMFISAAAQTWEVPRTTCITKNSTVIHPPSGRQLKFGQLTELVKTLPIPKTVTLKATDQFTLIGKPVLRIDSPLKVSGQAKFGQDIRLPKMLYATVVRCPVFGGQLKFFEAQRAKRISGVIDIFAFESRIAIVGKNFWAVQQAKNTLTIDWDDGPNANLNDHRIRQQFIDHIDQGKTVFQQGNVKPVFDNTTPYQAIYEVPYLAHACMEPMNCTAHVQADRCDVWAPTQGPGPSQRTAVRITGLESDKVFVHSTFIGGGFGRRAEQDFIADAVHISQKMQAPVQVIWTREEDIQQDFYRPASYNTLTASLDSAGKPLAWRHRIASPAILKRVAPFAVRGGVDPTSIEGAANLPYAIAHQQIDYALVDPGVPVGFWRSVGNSINAFVTECFLDELAAKGQQDPYALRLELLADKPRHRQVLELAAKQAGWGKPLPKGRYRGLAVAKSFASYVAQVAEISITDQQINVHRVVCAVDCGMAVNPLTIEAQMQGAIVFGLTAALKGTINIDHGRVMQSNFDTYPLLAMHEMPTIEVHIVNSTHPPTGIGEPGVPPIAPAIANAVFAATGKPVRQLPIILDSTTAET